MARQPRILAVPYPAQGHVTPLLKLSYEIASHGIKVTFVNTEFIHAKIIAAMSHHRKEQTSLTFASIPDGLKHDADRKDVVKLMESLSRVMPGYLAELTKKINQSNMDEPITCIVADIAVGWILDDAETFGVEKIAFWPAGPAVLEFLRQVPKLIEEGHLDSNGNLTKIEQISLSKEIPAWNNMNLAWSFPGDIKSQQVFWEVFQHIKHIADKVTWLLCNTFYELDSSSCNFSPNILPIGPLLTSGDAEKSAFSGSFWLEDDSCLSWLDKQEAGSVAYVAFGSSAVFSQEQFEELALGLELSGKPFLWVVRSDLANGPPHYAYPDGFLERLAGHGKIVEWAPQEKVLAHPSIACFMSHCGWNSTIEGISHGVPFLCWPYFGDQFHNQDFICEIWKVGLMLNPDKSGIRSRHEICGKIENLLTDDSMKVNALRLQNLAQISISKGGSSFRNLEKFIDHLKD